ncbi:MULTISPECIES: tripartite tricarboxylate transporter substrate binding protein [unclassified Cupriavidus]|jgi:tripartite-type tricarboxylate transporter receptor subunit TctC|uniref:Bug family tripartite tricarboxylate transporter substrate binding protein n=1 Tax=unclassified Cupriavidus TaxID=2640874 RepID=UPI001C004E16|nr:MULTISPECIES: tripartite tricarboxylate transporter substrate binding protein [unclassified Cupriavidus]MCA3186094.1 tripartite tricarboxylate transporter substrate binding protein [Cupriavidus sp.]MCA3189058.1 tripartite tricarboxylate transporter substrate binding protein [Cupriavidus sp.]MCA3198777.1 tripartite tricarboxylate transporter substrate binding protein [Cupriavidus sp.]MCA3201523.1 tripartite tricarboxylate transporter substrate binding protein [Cupriavidus sp.]MCA3209921.1 tr
MNSAYRRTLCAALALAGLSLAVAAPGASAADSWPTKPIKYVVPFSPGGVSDATARIVAEGLSQRLGQPVVIDNKPGVSGILGTQFVARAEPDGYTIMGGTITTHAVNPFFYKKLGYDPVKDFVAVSLVGTVSNVLVVSNESQYKSVDQIVAALKAKPGGLTFGTAGPGSSQQLSGQLFQSITGTRLQQISYKGGAAAMTDLIGGQIDLVFETVAAAKPMLDGKRVRAIGVTSTHALPGLPGVQPLADQGLKGFEMQSWQGIFAPAGTPKPIVDRLASEIAAVVATPAVQQRLRTLGVEPEGKSSAAFTAFQRAEVSKWGKIIQAAGVVPE